jgi:hypothetical protein
MADKWQKNAADGMHTICHFNYRTAFDCCLGICVCTLHACLELWISDIRLMCTTCVRRPRR